MRVNPGGWMIAVGLMAALQASPAQAQTAVAMAGDPVEKAIDLERKAAALHGQPERYAEAARLHVRASQLRSAADPMRVRNLSMAGRLFYYAGLKADAFQSMQSAAESALSAGDVLSAANHMVDASHIAAERGDQQVARRLADRAKLLTASPLLGQADRAHIEARLKVAAI